MKFIITLTVFILSGFAIAGQPVISSIAPLTGQVGTTVMINGSNFAGTPSGNIVYFGATRATVNSSSSSQINVTVPAGATYDKISVVANGLFAQSMLPFTVTYPNGNNLTEATFYNKTEHTTDLHPNWVVVKDFDADGKPDIASANFYTITGIPASFSILRNTTAGNTITMAPKQDFANGADTYFIASEDLDNDGKPDIVATSIVNQNISVFRNTSSPGAVSFAPNVDYASGTNPYSVGIADIDGDGRADLAVVNALSNSVSIYRNLSSPGSISFAPKIDYVTGSYPQHVALGDFDSDGKVDVAVTNNLSYSFSVFRNLSSSGTISLATRQDITCGSGNEPKGLLTADLNADQKLDLCIVISNSSTSSSFAQIFRNQSTTGAISFAFGTSFSGSNSANSYHLAAGDINGDGKPDLALGVTGINIVNVVQNNCSGNFFNFNYSQSFGSFSPYALALADFNNDSRPELISSFFTSNNISIFQNRCGLPAITNVSPAAGGAGNTITIYGAEFTGATSVTFGGIPVASFIVQSAGIINAVLANGATGQVVVTTPQGVATWGNFTYYPPPTISSFTPNSAIAGTQVTITGNNFNNISSVSFGGVAASSFSVSNATTITAIVGNGASGNVTVTSPYGTTSLGGFTFIPAPVISSFSPTSGQNGTNVTITGNNFTGATSVKFGNIPASSFIVTSPNTINAIIIGGNSGPVSVTTPGGTASNGNFTYIPSVSPSISSINPIAAAVGSILYINGNNFSAVPGENIVYVGGRRAIVQSASATQLAVQVPAGALYEKVTVNVNYLTASSPQYFIPTYTGSGIINSHTFDGPYHFIINDASENMLVFDADSDGRNDIIGCWSGINVLRNITSHEDSIRFEAPKKFLPGLHYMQDVDLNGDGKREIIGGNSSFNADIYSNNSILGNILFSYAGTISFPPLMAYSISCDDMNADGKPDVGLGASGRSVVYANNSVPNLFSFGLRTDLLLSGLNRCTTADIDNDGRPDIVALNSQSKQILVYRNISTGTSITFASPVAYSTRIDNPLLLGPTGFATGDIDKDGKIDIIVSNTQASRSISIWRNVSSTGVIDFLARQDFMTGQFDPHRISLSDADGDAKPDIILCQEYGSDWGIFKNTSVSGNISLSGFVNYHTGNLGQIASIVTGDFNGDNMPDVVMENHTSRVSVYINRANDLFLCNGGANALLQATQAGTNFQWQQDAGSGFVNISNSANFSGVTTNMLNIIQAPSGWYGYRYRCLVNGIPDIIFTLRFGAEWLGAVSSAWENPANWSCGRVPDANTDVYIFSGNVQINSNVVIRSLRTTIPSNITVGSAASLQVLH